MTAWRAIFGSELLKLHRTPVLGIVVLAPYLPLLAFFFFGLIEGERFLVANPVAAWTWLADAALHTWTLLLLPIFVSLLVATAAAVEHRADGFEHLFVQPIARWRLYAGKQLTFFALVGAGFLFLASGIVVAGLALRALRPGLGFEDPIPWLRLARSTCAAFLASGLLVAFLTWVALVRKDFATPLGLGIVALASHLMLLPAGPEWTAYHPASWPVEVARTLAAGEWGLAWLLAGGVGGLAFAAVAGASFIRRDVS